ncbi:hypothetical protein TVAG_346200 [Trichomonas vaginalis G3]|uniref:Uncharacterized protein n=1 Tax=Trichomonas vaginalis (strain ATCC PRA-98 / G3) TaxID=412133 RepID=A2FK10_TRIV3|nr:ribonuclease inhibitor domain-containing protein [Trichomonas vaginalis G3]EAX94757.1 hypothetical protein TVAG_346200 [Trichomonas vaginalis G3]KAI5491997.1 ribonuclease inhibitor domain-containing protein [Trichomonas vaginalis G3]|eukprot:XP_001307687.1 hypothetical protein [Trichomonas vaginalis G3]
MDTYYMLGTGVTGDMHNADPDDTCENLIIKNEIGNIPVTCVGINAFTGHSCLKTVYIPNTIVYLGFDCFAYISTLKTVIFEERYNTSLEFDQGVFYQDTMNIIRFPSKISSSKYHVLSKSKIEKVIYCGMDKIDADWFEDISPPTVFVHYLYPYNKFANDPHLVRTQECGLYTKCLVHSIMYVPFPFFCILSSLLTINIC